MLDVREVNDLVTGSSVRNAAVQETAAQWDLQQTGGSINKVGLRFQSFRINSLELVDQNSASWNHVANWLRQVDQLQQAA